VQIKKHCGSYYTWTIFPWPLHVGQMDSCFKNAFCITTLRIPPQVVHVCGLAPGGKPLTLQAGHCIGMEKDTCFVQPSTASHTVNSTVTTTWPPHQSRYPSEPELFLFLSAAAQIRRYPEKYNHTRSFVQELLGHCDYRDFSI